MNVQQYGRAGGRTGVEERVTISPAPGRARSLSDLPAELPAERETSLCSAADHVLVALIDTRDSLAEPALGVLYDRYAATVYALALHLAAAEAAAEELLQQTFWCLWAGEGRDGANGTDVAAMLLRSVHVLGAATQSPASSVTTMSSIGAVSQEPPCGEPAATNSDAKARTPSATGSRDGAAALASIAPEARRAIELAHYGGMDYTRIAAAEGLTAAGAAQRLSIGLSAVAAHLTQRDNRVGAGETSGPTEVA